MKIIALKNEGQTSEAHAAEQLDITPKWSDNLQHKGWSKTTVTVGTEKREFPVGNGIYLAGPVIVNRGTTSGNTNPYLQYMYQPPQANMASSLHKKLYLPFTKVAKFEAVEDNLILELHHCMADEQGSLPEGGMFAKQEFRIPLPSGVPRVVRRNVPNVGDLQIERHPTTGIQVVRLRYNLVSSFAPTVIDFSSHPFADNGYTVLFSNATVSKKTSTSVTLTYGEPGPGSFILEGKY